jgi:hypothetical protein
MMGLQTNLSARVSCEAARENQRLRKFVNGIGRDPTCR